MKRRTLGQVAYKALISSDWHYPVPSLCWEYLHNEDRRYINRVAKAVSREVRRRNKKRATASIDCDIPSWIRNQRRRAK